MEVSAKTRLEHLADIRDRTYDARDFLEYLAEAEQENDFSGETLEQVIVSSLLALEQLREAEDLECEAWHEWRATVDPDLNPSSSVEWGGEEPESAIAMRIADEKLHLLGDELRELSKDTFRRIDTPSLRNRFNTYLASGESPDDPLVFSVVDMWENERKYKSKYSRTRLTVDPGTNSSPAHPFALNEVKDRWRQLQPEGIKQRREALLFDANSVLMGVNSLYKFIDSTPDNKIWREKVRLIVGASEEGTEGARLVDDAARLFHKLQVNVSNGMPLFIDALQSEKAYVRAIRQIQEEAKEFEENEYINIAVRRLAAIRPRIEDALDFLENYAAVVTSSYYNLNPKSAMTYDAPPRVSAEDLRGIVVGIRNPPSDVDPNLS